MGSDESQSDPQDLTHTTDYDADDKDYEQRTKAYIATSWDVPSRQEHAELDHVLTYITCKRLPNYTMLQMLGQCEPINDFTCLCQHLCMDGTAQ